MRGAQDEREHRSNVINNQFSILSSQDFHLPRSDSPHHLRHPGAAALGVPEGLPVQDRAEFPAFLQRGGDGFQVDRVPYRQVLEGFQQVRDGDLWLRKERS